eukprot:CAMPEP_0179156030 /NCGR_PEP_ID=MMETSP0796-20121207/76042_1 /TAXON_ID=73915 /ORGANISM="Pyrodinium bahamense, Strain pbaha01" /LENGTH=42 /DNA_ID= /DNA_START= /DNA_END= /DNA_ORIENTATION=
MIFGTCVATLTPTVGTLEEAIGSSASSQTAEALGASAGVALA